MKIVVFGASGAAGLQLVDQALQRGHEVTHLCGRKAVSRWYTPICAFRRVMCFVKKTSARRSKVKRR